jgi:hypothetical protein
VSHRKVPAWAVNIRWIVLGKPGIRQIPIGKDYDVVDLARPF